MAEWTGTLAERLLACRRAQCPAWGTGQRLGPLAMSSARPVTCPSLRSPSRCLVLGRKGASPASGRLPRHVPRLCGKGLDTPPARAWLPAARPLVWPRKRRIHRGRKDPAPSVPPLAPGARAEGRAGSLSPWRQAPAGRATPSHTLSLSPSLRAIRPSPPAVASSKPEPKSHLIHGNRYVWRH